MIVACLACSGPSPDAGEGLGYAEAVTLGSDDGPGLLPGYATDLVRRSDGGWVLMSAPGVPKAFDSDGGFESDLGFEGQGPGEFTSPYFGAVLPGDSLLVSDPAQGRLQVFDPAGGYTRTVRLPCRADMMRVVSWPDSVVFVGRSCGDDLGPWLKIADMSEASALVIGALGDTALTRGPSDRRVISTPRGGTLWLVAGGEGWSAHEWTLDGRDLAALGPSGAWSSLGRAGTDERYPTPAVVAVELLTADTLVVASVVARDDWLAAWPGLETGDATPSSRPHEADLWETLVEFRDARSGAVLGSQRLPGLAFRILPDGSVATRRLRGPGYPFVSVFQRRTQAGR